MYTLQGGEGLFEILSGSWFDEALLFRGAPVALLWCDCGGSVARYLVRSRRSLDVNSEIRHLRHVTDGGFDPGQPIASQIAPLLALFTDGQYLLTYRTVNHRCEVIGFEEASSLFNHRDYFYPCDALVTTRPSMGLASSRIEYYRSRIGAGLRPVILTVLVGYVEIVLDGHHKLSAYRAVGVNPAIVCIGRDEEPAVSPEIAQQAFSEAPSYYQGYLDLKRKYDHEE